jgi:hypothetical protein
MTNAPINPAALPAVESWVPDLTDALLGDLSDLDLDTPTKVLLGKVGKPTSSVAGSSGS